MSPVAPTIFKDVEERMKQSLAILTRSLGELRGGRATPALVEHVIVEYYGAPTPLKQLAAISAPEPRLLVIQPWDAKVAPEIEKAIMKTGLGITPQVDGKVVRLPIPALTGDRREELVKLSHKLAEEGRIAIRNARRDANDLLKGLKTKKQVSEDEHFKAHDQVQKLTDRYIEQVNALLTSKEQELRSV